MLDDFSVLKRPFRTCPSKTTYYLRACSFHQFTWTFLVAFSNGALSFLHHISVRTSFIGTGAIPFNIHPLRFGWNFPRGIWKLFSGGRGVSRQPLIFKNWKKLGYFWSGDWGLCGYLWSFLLRGRWDGMAWGQSHTETNDGIHTVA